MWMEATGTLCLNSVHIQKCDVPETFFHVQPYLETTDNVYTYKQTYTNTNILVSQITRALTKLTNILSK